MADTSSTNTRQAVVRFLDSIKQPEARIDLLSDDEALFISGAIDSLAVLHIVQFLEDTYAINFMDSGRGPEALSSIGAIVTLIESHRSR